MNGGNLEEKMRKWATGLGFVLPDGSAPTAQYFVSLTATPQRCELWKMLFESVLPKKVIENMRKQLLLSKLKKLKENQNNFNFKQSINRIDLWRKQNTLQKEFDKQKFLVDETNQNILIKASDLLFNICKLSELEKQCEEYKEKTFVLQLLSKRIITLTQELEKIFLKEKRVNHQHNFSEEKLKHLIIPLSQTCEVLKYSLDFAQENSETIKSVCWKNLLICKKLILEYLFAYLEELNTRDLSMISKKEAEGEKKIRFSITQILRKVTEKSLLVLINNTEGQKLNLIIKKFEEKLEKLSVKDNSFGKDNFISIKKYAKNEGEKAQQDFLRKEILCLEDEIKKKLEVNKGEEEYQQILKTLELLCIEIYSSKFSQEERNQKFNERLDSIKILAEKIKKETNDKDFKSEMAETIAKLKIAHQKQTHLFLETPLDAFRMIDSSPQKLFECEFPPACLNNYGGEFKQFFSSILIPPYQGVDSVLKKVKIKKKLVEQKKKFMLDVEVLSESEAKMFTQLNFIEIDKVICDKNFNESEKILKNILSKVGESEIKLEFLNKVLLSWAEQPYRSMINDSEINLKAITKSNENQMEIQTGKF